jgi:hypothetical protein
MLRNNLVNSELTPLLKYQCLSFHPQEDHAKAGSFFHVGFELCSSSTFFPYFNFPFSCCLLPILSLAFSFLTSISLEKSEKLANLQEQGFRMWTSFHEQQIKETSNLDTDVVSTTPRKMPTT